ncbi:MAG: hypothetical protein JWM57_744 [Phycisphaerales bacterium]|nr:hypothetical protein [Phycisphaerales bacterium]
MWLLLGVLLIGAAGVPPVNRTQEARVLETAREMIGRPIDDWLIPKLNGHVRLRKPPLAYWASAASMSVFGENERAGRLPTVLLSWLSIGATYAIARRWFDAQVAILSAGALAGSWLFFKHGMLAETDAYAAAGMTLGVYAIVRAGEAVRGRDILWLHAAAACFAGIILAKGPPAAYLLLFWVGRCWANGDWRALGRFVTRGGILTLLVLAVPWFLYVRTHTAAEGQLGADFANSADGGDHPGPPWAYIPMLIKATVPWTGVWVVALAMAGATLLEQYRKRSVLSHESETASSLAPNPELPHATARAVDSSDTEFAPIDDSRLAPWRRGSDSSTVALLNLAIWGAAVLLPLCAWGNKQFHYLLPVMPPTMILVGWALAAATRKSRRARAVAVVAFGTAVLLSLAPMAQLIAATRLRPNLHWSDFAMCAGLIAAEFAVGRAWKRGRQPAAVALCVYAVVVMVTIHAWLPAVMGGRSRLASIQLVEKYPNARFVFRTAELPVMSWSMRRAVPIMDDAAITAAGDANLVVLDQQQDGEKKPLPPAGFNEAESIRQGDNTLHVFMPLAAGPQANESAP